jgi:hypothetical protein
MAVETVRPGSILLAFLDEKLICIESILIDNPPKLTVRFPLAGYGHAGYHDDFANEEAPCY